jgi:hypothetical protein
MEEVISRKLSLKMDLISRCCEYSFRVTVVLIYGNLYILCFMIPAKRGVVIELGEPWGDVTVERSMTSLKFYHDFVCEVEHYSYAFGPCWEPVIAQCNLSKFNSCVYEI